MLWISISTLFIVSAFRYLLVHDPLTFSLEYLKCHQHIFKPAVSYKSLFLLQALASITLWIGITFGFQFLAYLFPAQTIDYYLPTSISLEHSLQTSPNLTLLPLRPHLPHTFTQPSLFTTANSQH